MESKRPLFQAISRYIDAYHRCKANGNNFEKTHALTLFDIQTNMLPHGSGIDNGTSIDLDASSGDKLVLYTAYHHMNETGYYDGWTHHRVVVKPSLMFGFTLTITGPDKNAIKEYLHDVFSHALSSNLVESLNGETIDRILETAN